MGNCCCYFQKTDIDCIQQIAIKFPHGLNYIKYNNNLKCFEKDDNINIWISNLYKDRDWTNWIVYNDETSYIGNNQHKKGHCKGILSWNEQNISWMCHSVPNFPRSFNGNTISEIEHGEYIYGQSFQYIEIPYDKTLLYSILSNIHIMKAHVYIEKYTTPDVSFSNMILKNCNSISSIKLNENITHIAKSPHYEIDIYSDYIVKEYPFKWYIETWIRGHHIESVNENIVDIKTIKFENVHFTESQDHSKWGVSDNSFYWIGDLDRMTSQYKRGGGGFIINNKSVQLALSNIFM